MKMKIYNYNNKIAIVELPKVPQTIFVNILTGDEIVTVIFDDGTSETYDSAKLVGDMRIRECDDGCYVVDSDNIKKWLNYSPNEGGTASYDRQMAFGG